MSFGSVTVPLWEEGKESVSRAARDSPRNVQETSPHGGIGPVGSVVDEGAVAARMKKCVLYYSTLRSETDMHGGEAANPRDASGI